MYLCVFHVCMYVCVITSTVTLVPSCNFSILQEAKDGVYKRLWDKISLDLDANMVDSNVEGYQKIRDENYAYIGTVIVKTHTHTHI